MTTDAAAHADMSLPVPLGTVVAHWGKVTAIGYTGCERYYWLTSHDGAVSMMPASAVEQMALLMGARQHLPTGTEPLSKAEVQD